MGGVDRLERVVLGLQADAAAPPGRSASPSPRRRDSSSPASATTISPSRAVLPAAHDDDVAVEDAGVDHRVALDAQQEVAAQRLGNRDVTPRRSGRRAAARRPRSGRASGSLSSLGRRRRRSRLTSGQLERPRLRRVAPQQSRALEVGEMRVNGRRRRQPDRLADLAHRRRIAVPVDVLDEEVPDLLLSACQLDVAHDASPRIRGRWDERVFAMRVETPADDVKDACSGPTRRRLAVSRSAPPGAAAGRPAGSAGRPDDASSSRGRCRQAPLQEGRRASPGGCLLNQHDALERT